MKKRTTTHNTAFSKRLKRLRWNLKQAQKWTGTSYENIKNYNNGRVLAPRPVMRLLAAYRLLHWGKH
jgi:hypothetical protein